MGICYGTFPVDAGVYIMSKLRIKHSVRTTIIGISLCGLVTKHDARRRITWTIMLISIDISFCFWCKHTINNSRFGEYEWNNYNIYHFLPIIEIIERWKWFIVIASRSCFHVYPSCWIASIDCHLRTFDLFLSDTHDQETNNCEVDEISWNLLFQTFLLS